MLVRIKCVVCNSWEIKLFQITYGISLCKEKHLLDLLDAAASMQGKENNPSGVLFRDTGLVQENSFDGY